MGTSASNTGIKGQTPLLPNWALSPGENNIEDEPEKKQDDQKQNDGDKKDSPELDKNLTQNWSSAKSAAKDFVNAKNNKSSKEAGRRFVKTYGNAKKATSASYGGIITGSTLAGFLGGFIDNGYEENLKKYGLDDCIGKSSEEVLASIADQIAPIGSTNDDAISRSAVMDTLDRLYEKLLNDGKDIEALGSLDEITLKDTVAEFVSSYIFKKWLYELGIELEKNALSESDVIKKENEMRVLIRSEVEIALRDLEIKTLSLTEGKGKEIIKEIFELAYSTLEK